MATKPTRSFSKYCSLIRIFSLLALLLSCLCLVSCTWIEGLIASMLNNPPHALFTANPSSGSAPLVVQFDASESSDPDGDTLQYHWDFGDGTSDSGVSTTHTYGEAQTGRTVTVVLTVTDEHGVSDSSDTNIVLDSAQRLPPPPPF